MLLKKGYHTAASHETHYFQRSKLLHFPYLHFPSILLFFDIMVSFSGVDLPVVALLFLSGEVYRMRKIWMFSAFIILMGVNSFDFRCNLPDESIRQETKKDQREVKIKQNLVFARLER
jgi:hypothetical protein